MPAAPRPRLVLVTPAGIDATFAPRLADALAGGDVAAVIVPLTALVEADRQAVADVLVPVIQEAGAAAILGADTRIVGRAKADGIHAEGLGEDLADAVSAFGGKRIVGVGNVRTRDEAMAAGEAGADYLLFGLLDATESPEAHPKTVALGTWWAELFEVPAIALAGSDLASVDVLAETRVEFVALRAAAWDHPDGARAAVAEANARLDKVAGPLAP